MNRDAEGPAVRVDAPTERTNERTRDIDLLPTLDVLRVLNAEDRTVPEAVGRSLPDLARAVDRAVAALRGGGRVHYVGAGTSGRLAVLDAAELIPTYNVPADWVVAHQAGGAGAFQKPVENAEDDAEAGAAMARAEVAAGDFVLGLTASGRTPYVLGALRAAREIGAGTALMSANPESAGDAPADLTIAVDTGPEPIAGSTRMKAGTAQKLVLTSFSTAVMIRMGRTYSNLMVSLLATNAKLRGRTVEILREATAASEDECARALNAADGDLKTALVHLLTGAEVPRAAAALTAADGRVRDALRTLGS
ncbi:MULTISPECIES: N-acetylmuramic acid 6-phosphate etherase [unclassified Saccharopolyspora]|uniref:N-acetylmuramic acid 6-phosphate etherase n=1 Tax=unclassified Saccharopolyspora TaxID=2646250 RepID=UPI001CD71404|nr:MULTISPECIES: N-acetylmuramic acid 6-phosphate etherase [unclassified Saccharopolyspora]MCA1186586.1 N-acetylmuramic acid 6-phosphate etherase [Saccharopolyspora sp. 6T]MCA1196058.1 N-acetylmuramic acid 6-phosphate etherase [Saccharopolyspora sp. 6V]MCA1226211.1 N-acetylmuramic acid 6-phosphate etherase [Saccharopolyspora sp. 6M]MCA1282278.1 N-acetylmuramic acid 6-phosphate etherase [Saccharopolyspora sp. 7B]